MLSKRISASTLIVTGYSFLLSSVGTPCTLFGEDSSSDLSPGYTVGYLVIAGLTAMFILVNALRSK